MAIFHLSAKVISRGKGQSAIAAAAYRSGEKLLDEQTGEQKLYRARAERILYTDILAPLHAPEWAFDRNELWNHAERAEKRKDAQLAREIEIALPHELTDQQREWLVKDFAREAFVRKGYVVDIAIHGPDADSDHRNHHAHLLVTRRTIGPNGFAATKDWRLDKEQLGRWREQWANLVNRHLERHGHDARIDHRSLKEQGLDREPTIHLGYAANEMTARGAPSDRMAALNEILARNELRFDLEALGVELKALEQEQEKERQKAAQDRARTTAGQGSSPDAGHDAYLAAMEARRKLNEKSRDAVPEAKPEQARAAEPKIDATRAARPDRQAEAAAKKPDQRKQETPKPGTTKSQQPSGEWTIGKSWVQNPQGQHMPYVSPEHVQAIQRAAEQAQAAARAAGQKAAAGLSKEAQNIRHAARTEQRLDTHASRTADQEVKRQQADANTPNDRFHRTTRRGDVQQQPSWRAPDVGQAARQTARTGLRVVNRATGIVSSLGSFVDSLLATTPRQPKPKKIDFHTLINDPDAARLYDEQHLAEAQRRNMAADVLDDIKRDIAAGRDLKAEDISRLPREHLEQIKAHGDPYVLQWAASSRDWSEKYWGGGNDWSGGSARGRERERE